MKSQRSMIDTAASVDWRGSDIRFQSQPCKVISKMIRGFMLQIALIVRISFTLAQVIDGEWTEITTNKNTTYEASLSQLSTTTSINQAINEVTEKYKSLKLVLENQIVEVEDAHVAMFLKIENWYLTAPELKSHLEEGIATAIKLCDTSGKHLNGIGSILESMAMIDSADIEEVWIDELKENIVYAEELIKKAKEFLKVIFKVLDEFQVDQEMYEEAKYKEKLETETEITADFTWLSLETAKEGKKAHKMLSQALKEWSSLLSTYCKPENTFVALQHLEKITEPIMTMMEGLKPEDIQDAVTNAHHAMDDVKSLFYSCNVPSSIVKQNLTPVQLGIYSCCNKAKFITLESHHN